MARYGLPERLRRQLALGMLEESIAAWETIERRTLGIEAVVFDQTAPAPEFRANRQPKNARLNADKAGVTPLLGTGKGGFFHCASFRCGKRHSEPWLRRNAGEKDSIDKG